MESRKHAIVVDAIRGHHAASPAPRETLNIASDGEEVTRSPRENSESEEPISSDDSAEEEEDDLDSQSSEFLAKEVPRF